MRAVQVITLSGPEALEIRELPDPVPTVDQVLIKVHRVGAAFPDLLLSRGEYQLRPEPPFTLGVDIAGVVVSSPGGQFAPGDRVAAVSMYGGAADLAAVAVDSTFALPDSIDFDAGAALPMNYLTAEFTLGPRGRIQPGETVLVHGAAGGVGTASLQVAKGMGATTIGVVSTEQKAEVARAAGADHVVMLADFKQATAQITQGRGVDAVVDMVSGDVFLDSVRSLAPHGRLLVVGFAAGQGIPEIKVNRLLLNNTDVRGVNWGAYAMLRPGYMQEQWSRLVPMMDSGVISPPVSEPYELENFGQALMDLDQRAMLGKAIVRVAD